MLVLSRKQDEKIVIGDHITITILKIRGNTVRLGIEAPRDIQVVRGELVPKDQTAPAAHAPVTVEFKSHGTNSRDHSPSLRVITEEVELELNPDPNEKVVASHRLQELVSKLVIEERQV